MVKKGSSGSLEQDVPELLHRLCAALPPKSAAVWVKPLPEGGVGTTVIPANGDAARIAVYVQDGGPIPTLWLGRGTPIEIPLRGKPTVLELIEEICSAVFAGRFSEEVWEAGGEVRRSVGSLERSGRTDRFYYFAGLLSGAKTERKLIQYAPYQSPPDTESDD